MILMLRRQKNSVCFVSQTAVFSFHRYGLQIFKEELTMQEPSSHEPEEDIIVDDRSGDPNNEDESSTELGFDSDSDQEPLI